MAATEGVWPRIVIILLCAAVPGPIGGDPMSAHGLPAEPSAPRPAATAFHPPAPVSCRYLHRSPARVPLPERGSLRIAPRNWRSELSGLRESWNFRHG